MTLLSGAAYLIDDGYIEEAERIYFELWTLAKSQGNEAEKEITVLELTKFLRARGRASEAEQLAILPEFQNSKSTELQAIRSSVQDIIVVGSSAGGVEAVSLLLSGLPEDFAAAVLVVQQTPGHSPSELAEMLNERSTKV